MGTSALHYHILNGVRNYMPDAGEGSPSLFKGDECLPPWFFTDHPGFMALSRNILGKQDIPLAKQLFITAAHFNFSPSFKGDNILPADNVVPGRLIIYRDFSEEKGLYTSRFGKKAQGTAGFQLNLNFIKMGLVILPRIKSRDLHGLASDMYV
jgi:hypothetical protein